MVASMESLCSLPAVISVSTFPEVKSQIFSFSSSSSFNNFKVDTLDTSSLYNFSKYDEWKNSLIEVVKKSLKGFCPVLKDLLPYHLFPLVGLEMIKLALMLESKFDLNFKVTEKVISSAHFTSKGTIDNCKAARELVKDFSLTHLQRFEVACYFFMEDIIPDLWHKVCDDSSSFLQESYTEYFYDDPLILWYDYLRNENKQPTSNTSNSMEDFSEKVFSYAFSNVNLEGIKFYFKSNALTDFSESCYKKSLISYCSFLGYKRSTSLDLLLSWEFKNFVSISFFLRQLENKKKTIINALGLNFLRGLLLWPFQDLFLKVSSSYYINESSYYHLLHNIVDLIDDKYLGESYNYRLLFKEFWIKSNRDMKEYVLKFESRNKHFDLNLIKNLNISHDKVNKRTLIAKLILLNEFTPDDEENFLLILQNANSRQKYGIAENNECMFRTCVLDLLSAGKFKLVNLYIDNLIFDISDRRNLKEKIAFDSLERVFANEENFDLADQIVNWAADPRERERLKTKIFSENFDFCKVAELYIDGEFSLTSIDELLKWFFHTDDKIVEWKKNGVFHKDFCECFVSSQKNDHTKRFDMFLNWLGHSSDKITIIKNEILRKTFTKIFKILFRQTLFTIYDENILYLCLYNNNLLSKFIDDLNVWCKTYPCLFCNETERFHHTIGDSEPYCDDHGSSCIISKNRIDDALASFLDRLISSSTKLK